MLDILCWVAVAVLGGISLLYACFELHYFMRMLLSVTVAKLFKKKVHILDTTSVTGVCLTTDIDTLLYHMNNARYIRELDFARVDFYERSDLYRVIRAKGGAVVQGACTIRYRRFLRPFTIFKIVSKIIYWDDKSIFMEHRFVTPRDEFVRAIAVCRQRVINANAEDVMKELLGRPRTPNAAENGTLSPIEKPELPLDVQKWVESNDISSANLRNGC